MCSLLVIFVYRERIKKKYYEIRFPEMLLKVVIHYHNNKYREYWRLIPEDFLLQIGEKRYEFSDSASIKPTDTFGFLKDDKVFVTVEGKTYEYDKKMQIHKRFNKYPEIHYFYNVPSPLIFDIENKELKFTGAELETFKENDLFTKLLTLSQTNSLIMFCLIASVMSALISGLVFAKMMGWLK